MVNRHVDAASGVPNRNSSDGIDSWSRRQYCAAAASGIAVVVLSIASLALMTHALRLESESANVPARFQADFASTARSSWIGGIAAIAGMVANACSLAFVRKNKLVAPLAILVLTLLGMIAIAIAFKPS